MKYLGLTFAAVIVLVWVIIHTADKPKAANIEPIQQEKLVDQEKYFPYSENALSNSVRNGKTLLFFAAGNWCNTCSARDSELSKKANVLPNDVSVLKIDYDNDKEMNRKYNVVTQHTLILLDENGNEITRWVGGDLANLLEKLKEAKA